MVFQRDGEGVQEGDGLLLRVDVARVRGVGGFLLRDVQPDGAGDVAGEGRDPVPLGAALPPARVGGGHAEGDGEGDDEAGRVRTKLSGGWWGEHGDEAHPKTGKRIGE